MEKLWKRDQAYTYGRTSTPTVRALEEAIALIGGGAATALTASGYQAVSTANAHIRGIGRPHILVADSVYAPTRNFCDRLLARLGVETTYFRSPRWRGIDKLVRTNTRLIFTESPGWRSLRGAGHPGDRRGGKEARALAAARQHVGDAALLRPVRPRRRCRDRCGDEIHRRSRGRDARRDHVERARGKTRGARQGAIRRLPRLGGDLSRHARPAHARNAPGAAPKRRPRDRASA